MQVAHTLGKSLINLFLGQPGIIPAQVETGEGCARGRSDDPHGFESSDELDRFPPVGGLVEIPRAAVSLVGPEVEGPQPLDIEVVSATMARLQDGPLAIQFHEGGPLSGSGSNQALLALKVSLQVLEARLVSGPGGSKLTCLQGINPITCRASIRATMCS